MHMFLAVLLWIFLALLGLILLLLILPAEVSLEFKTGNLTVKAALLGVIRFTLFGNSKKPRPGKKKKQGGKKPSEDAQKKTKKSKAVMEMLPKMLSAASKPARVILRTMHFSDIMIIVPVHKEDAAQTATACAETQAELYSGLAVLQDFLKLSFKCIHIIPDFAETITCGPYFSCKITALPIIIIWAALYFFFRYIKQNLSARENPDAVSDQSSKRR